MRPLLGPFGLFSSRVRLGGSDRQPKDLATLRHEDIKTQRLVEYATRLKVGAVNRRLGYLLELYKLGQR
jgi:predicted transcriptional regulator of viral defense system